MCRFDHVNIISTSAAGNDPLLNPQLSMFDFIQQGEPGASLGNVIRRNLNFVQNILQILIKRINFIYVGRVKRQGDHRLDGA